MIITQDFIFYYFWTVRLVSFAVLLQTVELLQVRKVWEKNGIFDWSILRDQFSGLQLKVLDRIYEEKVFKSLLVLNILSVIYLILAGPSLLILFPFVTYCLLFIRFRGVTNGGSDYMTFLILFACVVHLLFPSSVLLAQIGLWYIGIQTMLSYTVAGFVKIVNSEWRSGVFLKRLLTEMNYSVPENVLFIAQKVSFLKLASRVVIIFECSFPVMLLGRGLFISYLAFAICFHLFNFFILGLNRFVFAWLAAYPALYYLSFKLSEI